MASHLKSSTYFKNTWWFLFLLLHLVYTDFAGGLAWEEIMQRLDRTYIIIGLCWVIAGMIFGVWLGASNHLNYANSHAHINLLGFVTSVLFGMLFWAFPTMAKSRVAIWQFAAYQIGVALLVIGKVIFDTDGSESPLLKIGSVIVILATAAMLWLFVARADRKAL